MGLDAEGLEQYQSAFSTVQSLGAKKVLTKEEIDRLYAARRTVEDAEVPKNAIQVDVFSTRVGENGESEFVRSKLYTRAEAPNAEYISSLNKDQIRQVSRLKSLLERKNTLSQEEFKKEIYDIPKENLGNGDLKKEQAMFYGLVYNLLFAQNSGPKLVFFLKEVENDEIFGLLDV
jgi:lysyl-tRNA synthetase class I